MFNKVNLANINCEDLCITTNVKLSSALAKRILSTSHAHKKPAYAIWGRLYKFGRIPHAVRAEITHVQRNEYKVEFRYTVGEMSKPPRDFKSPEILATLLAEEPQEVMLECDAIFIYDKDRGWRSGIEIPLPLSKEKKEEDTFSHIEAVRFSKREHGQIQYAIEVTLTENNDVLHWINYTQTWKGALSKEIPEQLLAHCSELSRPFVVKQTKGMIPND